MELNRIHMKINNKTLFTANIILNSVPSLIDYIHIIEGGNEIQIVTNKSKINKLTECLKSWKNIKNK